MGTDLQTLKDLVKTQLAAQRDRAPASNRSAIGVGLDKTFRLPDGLTTSEPFEAFIVDFRYINAYYTSRYVPGEYTPPVCWSIGRVMEGMEPDGGCTKPQNDTCEGCPRMEWGSGANNKGRACKNGVKLALISPDAQPGVTPWTLNLSPTALGKFGELLRSLASREQSLMLTKVLIGFDAKSDYPLIRIQEIGAISDNTDLPILEAYHKAQEILDRPLSRDD